MAKKLPTVTPIDDEKVAFLTWLDGYLGSTREVIEAINPFDTALGVANQQKDRWARLLTIFDSPQLRDSAAWQQLLELRQTLLRTQPARAERGDTKTALIIYDLPIIKSDAPQERIADGQKYPLLAAALLVNRCRTFLLKSAGQDIAPFLHMAAFWELSQLVDPRTELIKQAVSSEVQGLAKIVANEFAELARVKNDLSNAFTRDQKSLSVAVQDLSASKAKFKEDTQSALAEWKDERTSAVKALRDEINEYIKIETSIDLWRTKANWHTIGYATLGTIFGACLIAVSALFVLSIYYGYATTYVQNLVSLAGNNQFLAISLITIPTLAIAWLLRFIARLAMQNLTLAHDARQRHAQIRTYLRLLGDPKKPISEKERILALAALFRPLPGQGPDDLNPPTIADLLKEAQEGVSKTRG
jgi:hypothetical protein